MKIASRRIRAREKEKGDVPLYERSEFKLLFLLPRRGKPEGGGKVGEVFVPPYKSQYPLISAVQQEGEREREKTRGREKEGEKDKGKE